MFIEIIGGLSVCLIRSLKNIHFWWARVVGYVYVYVLINRKSQHDYTRVFTKLKKILNITLEMIVTDFENALINTLKLKCDVKIAQLCLFHFGQSLWKIL